RVESMKQHSVPMGWRGARKLSRVGKIVAAGTAGAEVNPDPANLDESPGIYMGDMMTLALLRKELYSGWTGWTTDRSEDSGKLRDVAAVLEQWAAEHKEERDDSGDPKSRLGAQMRRDRYVLAVIGWRL